MKKVKCVECGKEIDIKEAQPVDVGDNWLCEECAEYWKEML